MEKKITGKQVENKDSVFGDDGDNDSATKQEYEYFSLLPRPFKNRWITF